MNVGDEIVFVFEGKLGVFKIIEISDGNPGDLGRTLLKLKRKKDGVVFNHYKTDGMTVVEEAVPQRRI